MGYLHQYVLIMWKSSTDQMISNRTFEINGNEAVYVTKGHFWTVWLNMFSCVSSHDLLVQVFSFDDSIGLEKASRPTQNQS